MNEEKISLGSKKFDDFIESIGLKSRMKTLLTKHLEELADLEGDEFILKCVEHIYDEFFDVYIQVDFNGVDEQ